MNRWSFVTILGSRVVAAWLLVSAFAGSLWAEETTQHPRLGEKLSFHGRWMGIHVGYGWIEVKELTQVNGRPAYLVEVQGHTNHVLSKFYPIHDVLRTYIDAETLQPLRFEKKQEEGRYRSDEVVTFDHAAKTAHYQSLRSGETKTVELPEAFQDLISSIFWFRNQPLQDGVPLQVNLYTDEKIFPTEMRVSGPQTLEILKRGTFQAWRIDPQANFKGVLRKRGKIWAYVSADPERLPLMVRATTPWGQMSAILDTVDLPQ